MSQKHERRVCRGCKTKCTYFPARKLFFGKRAGDRTESAIEFCTGCGIRVTLHSTDPVVPDEGDDDLAESMRRQALNDK